MRSGEAPPNPSAEHDRVIATCPEGHGFLRRLRLEEAGLALDRCSHCGGVWFDHGEWDKLAEAKLPDDLATLWDPEVRAAQRSAREQQRIDDELRALIGTERFEALTEFASWLRDEPEKSRVLAWLHSHSLS